MSIYDVRSQLLEDLWEAQEVADKEAENEALDSLQALDTQEIGNYELRRLEGE